VIIHYYRLITGISVGIFNITVSDVTISFKNYSTSIEALKIDKGASY